MSNTLSIRGVTTPRLTTRDVAKLRGGIVTPVVKCMSVFKKLLVVYYA